MFASLFRTCRLPVATGHWQNPAMKIFTALITILFATLIATPYLRKAPPNRLLLPRARGGSSWSAKSSGDDEADDGDVEAQREPQAARRYERQLELHHQDSG